jgi:hypothetical protein
VGYLIGILVVTEVGFLAIDKFPMLLALEAAAIFLAGVVRWQRIQRESAATGTLSTR